MLIIKEPKMYFKHSNKQINIKYRQSTDNNVSISMMCISLSFCNYLTIPNSPLKYLIWNTIFWKKSMVFK